MNGKVGAFYTEGVQIGGFFNWAFTADMDANNKFTGWRGSAIPFWFFDEYEGDAEVRFYMDNGSVYYTTRMVLAQTPLPYNQFINERIILGGKEPLQAVQV